MLPGAMRSRGGRSNWSAQSSENVRTYEVSGGSIVGLQAPERCYSRHVGESRTLRRKVAEFKFLC